jgi:hypothetical protein
MYDARKVLVRKGVLPRTHQARFQRVQLKAVTADTEWRVRLAKRGFPETQAQHPSDFYHRRDPLVPVPAQVVRTLAHGLSFETRRRVDSYP